MHEEPAFIDLGFKPNRRGGWWYRDPCDRYTIQIIPSEKEQRGWTLGIARPGGMVWGRKNYPSPEAAAFQAFRETADTAKADELADTMQRKLDKRLPAIQARIKTLKEAHNERKNGC